MSRRQVCKTIPDTPPFQLTTGVSKKNLQIEKAQKSKVFFFLFPWLKVKGKGEDKVHFLVVTNQNLVGFFLEKSKSLGTSRHHLPTHPDQGTEPTPPSHRPGLGCFVLVVLCCVLYRHPPFLPSSPQWPVSPMVGSSSRISGFILASPFIKLKHFKSRIYNLFFPLGFLPYGPILQNSYIIIFLKLVGV